MEYETEFFDLGYKIYKPDFFFYGQDGKIKKITEIKSRNKDEKISALKALSIIEKNYNIKYELVSYEELLEKYRELPFSLTGTITEWIQSENTTIHKAAKGKLNGHYNIAHSIDTKRKIGEHTKKLWASNSTAKQRMVVGLKKSGLAQKGKFKKPREIRLCKECGHNFEVIATSIQTFCTQKCAGNFAIRNATKSYINKRKSIHENIRNYIIQWSLQNKDIVIQTPFNKIKSTLEPLIEDIHKEFGVKDFRVISKAVFGKDCGRKELLKFMQKLCNENVC
ncbi:restriction endonuclease [Lentibacillus sp. CBA3610]|uniref:restriction endonuclease n=1 Tax=Lentibacillus sp. CBA3610 TaxID=2518176 RepID=UPI0020D20821|nr:restriction endonuclease [Lentibacillus sp. CBA3610]